MNYYSRDIIVSQINEDLKRLEISLALSRKVRERASSFPEMRVDSCGITRDTNRLAEVSGEEQEGISKGIQVGDRKVYHRI